MRVYYKIIKDKQLFLHSVEGAVSGEEIVSFIKALEQHDLSNIRYVFFDLRKADFRFDTEEKHAIREFFEKLSKNLEINKWAIVFSSGHTISNFLDTIKDFWITNKDALKPFDMFEIENAYKWLGVDDIKTIHHDFLNEINK